MKYFKVVDSFDSDVIIDTNNTNYSLILTDKHTHFEFLNFITLSSNGLDLPLDFFISLNNNIAFSGNLYLENFPKSKNGIFEIFDVTNNPNHKNFFIKEKDLIRVVETLDTIGIVPFLQGNYLWEKIFEGVRSSKYFNKPKREESFFLFDNIQSCKYYIDNHKAWGVICEIEILESRTLFKADMSLLDQLPNNYTFKQAEQQATNYWLAKTSTNPVFEYLFQGKCKLKQLDGQVKN